MDFQQEICGRTLEYYDREHLYLVDGQIVPSVTQIIHQKFINKYKGVCAVTLKNASDHGTEVHKAIEDWCINGVESDLKELHNFKFLKNYYKFEVLENEKAIILFGEDDEPICAGRLDLVIENEEGNIGLADIKSVRVLDKEYLAYQLNTYRLAYQQCYGTKIEFLKGIHLKEDKRSYVNIQINEELVKELVEEWRNNE